jgi:Flp pilus assembly pilin Flp
MRRTFKSIRRHPRFAADNGQTIVEYALVVATISIAAIGVLMAMTNKIGVVFNTLANAL